jgi:hypothetical protein
VDEEERAKLRETVQLKLQLLLDLETASLHYNIVDQGNSSKTEIEGQIEKLTKPDVKEQLKTSINIPVAPSLHPVGESEHHHVIDSSKLDKSSKDEQLSITVPNNMSQMYDIARTKLRDRLEEEQDTNYPNEPNTNDISEKNNISELLNQDQKLKYQWNYQYVENDTELSIKSITAKKKMYESKEIHQNSVKTADSPFAQIFRCASLKCQYQTTYRDHMAIHVNAIHTANLDNFPLTHIPRQIKPTTKPSVIKINDDGRYRKHEAAPATLVKRVKNADTSKKDTVKLSNDISSNLNDKQEEISPNMISDSCPNQNKPAEDKVTLIGSESSKPLENIHDIKTISGQKWKFHNLAEKHRTKSY